jgi:hypothetical protein
MATRSIILKRKPDGSLKGVYCHWDGYPTCNGKILSEQYTTPDSLEDLFKLGHLSDLAKRLPAQWGENLPIYDDVEMGLLDELTSNTGVEYIYIADETDNGTRLNYLVYNVQDKTLLPMAEAITKYEKEQA